MLLCLSVFTLGTWLYLCIDDVCSCSLSECFSTKLFLSLLPNWTASAFELCDNGVGPVFLTDHQVREVSQVEFCITCEVGFDPVIDA